MTENQATTAAQSTAIQRTTAEQKEALTASGALDLIDSAIHALPWAAAAGAAAKVGVEAIRQHGQTSRTQIEADRDVRIAEISGKDE